MSKYVVVKVDRWGVPHIQAHTREDAYRAQGYMHAVERGWQMELLARFARGRAAELLGEDALAADRLTRTLRLPLAAEAAARSLDEHSLRILEPYAEGVLAGDMAAGVAAEHLALGSTQDWRQTVDDVLLDACAIALAMALALSDAWRRRLVRAWTEAELAWDEGPTQARARAIWEVISPVAAETAAGGSNAFAVAGWRTKGGAPLLAGDPHLKAQAPSAWMEMHLCHPGVNVSGATLPGLPNVIMGRNENVAWALTSSEADVADVYEERVDEQRGVYLHKGHWRPLTVSQEEIKVRGARARAHEVRATLHGPLLVSGLRESGSSPGVTEAMALRWTHAEVVHDQAAVELLNEASDWTSFREGLRRWRGAGQVVIYADAHGRLARQMVGPVPRRATGAPEQRVLCGWSGDDEWQGWIGFDGLPAEVDPEAGVVIAANDAPPGPAEARGRLGQDWDWKGRANRIAELLAATHELAPGDLARIQLDTLSPLARVLGPTLLAARPASAQALEVLETVRHWDFRMAVDAEGAAVFNAWLTAFKDELFGARLSREVLDALGKTRAWWTPWGVELLLDSVASLGPREIGNSSTAALERAAITLTSRLGRRPWRYGALTASEHAHPLGGRFSIGPLELAGAEDTICRGDPEGGGYGVPTLRQITDLGDPDGGLAALPTGNSGRPGSSHYDDQVEAFARGEYHKWPLTSMAVEAVTVQTLRLRPAAAVAAVESGRIE